MARQLSTRRVAGIPPDFILFPKFFSLEEQCLLLSAALRKLDAMDSGKFRRRRREYLRNPLDTTTASGWQHTQPSSDTAVDPVQALFLPDEYYDFQEGHFDGVIKRYREMHVTSWPEDIPELLPLLDRLQRVHPDQDTQTHILHLASDGEILPHVDNVEASGSWILGVSLGDERTLRLERSASPGENYEITLPSGSVYMQKDVTRYDYQHSILKKKAVGSGARHDGRQRLSIMIRDRINSHSL